MSLHSEAAILAAGCELDVGCADDIGFPGTAAALDPGLARRYDRAETQRLVLVMAIVMLAACAVAAMNLRREMPIEVARPGHCFIARDYGAKWHRTRQCRGLSGAVLVENVSIDEARERGDGARWQFPCRLCGEGLEQWR